MIKRTLVCLLPLHNLSRIFNGMKQEKIPPWNEMGWHGRDSIFMINTVSSIRKLLQKHIQKSVNLCQNKKGQTFVGIFVFLFFFQQAPDSNSKIIGKKSIPTNFCSPCFDRALAIFCYLKNGKVIIIKVSLKYLCWAGFFICLWFPTTC